MKLVLVFFRLFTIVVTEAEHCIHIEAILFHTDTEHMEPVSLCICLANLLLIHFKVVAEFFSFFGIVKDLLELIDIIVVDVKGRMIVDIFVIVCQLIKRLCQIFLSLSFLLLEISILYLLHLLLKLRKSGVFLLSESFQISLCVCFGIRLSKH